MGADRRVLGEFYVLARNPNAKDEVGEPHRSMSPASAVLVPSNSASQRRMQMLDYIEKHPGCGLRDLTRNLGISYARAHEWMANLEAMGVVEVTQSAGRNLHHLRGATTARRAVQLMELRRPECCQLHDWLRRAGETGLVQERVLDYAEQTWGWSRSKTYRLIERLRDVGILAWNKYGLLYAVEAGPDGLAEDPAAVAAEQTALLGAGVPVNAPPPEPSVPSNVASDYALLEALQLPAGNEDGWTPPHGPSPWTRPKRRSFIWCWQKCRYEAGLGEISGKS